MKEKIIAISGVSGSGKTTLCGNILKRFQESNLSIAGIISPPGFTNGVKTEITIMDIRTEEIKVLAARKTTPDGILTKHWQFFPDSIDFGATALQRSTPCDILFIDELGPLEILRNEGWTLAFDLLKKQEYKAAIVCVRPSLINEFQAIVGKVLPVELLPIEESRQTAYRAIIERIRSLLDQ